MAVGQNDKSGNLSATLNTPYNLANDAQISAEGALVNSGTSSGSIANPNAGEIWENQNFSLPYPNAPHDGGAEDQANTQYVTAMTEHANNLDYAISTAPTLIDKLGMMAGLAPIAAVGGAFIAPLAAGAAVSAGATAGGVVAGAAGGAAAGAFTGAADAALTGGNIEKGLTSGALMGGVTGGLANSGIGQSATNALNNAGLPSPISAGIVKGGLSAGTSALGSELSGGNVGNAALTAGVGGFLSGAVSNATGSSALGSVASKLGGYALSPVIAGSGTSSSSNTSSNGVTYLGAAVGAGGLASNGTAGTSGGTDPSLASTLTGAIPGLLSTAAGVYGAQNAAEAQTNADNAAIGTQQTALGNINSIWGTQQALGQGADTALGSALGTNGQPANYSNFENMPGYQFAVNQGTQAIQRQAASQGNAYTPNTSIAVGNYVTGTAMTDYNTYISQLMGAAGLGTTANQGLQTGQQTTANNISTLQQNIGQAQASGVSGSATDIGSLLGGATGTSLVNGVLGGGSGSSNGSGGSNGSGVNNGQDPAMFGGGTSTNAPYTPNYGTQTGYTDPSQMTGDYGWGSPTVGTSDEFDFLNGAGS